MTGMEKLKQAILEDALSRSIGAKDRVEAAKALGLLTIAEALEELARMGGKTYPGPLEAIAMGLNAIAATVERKYF